MAGGSVSGAQDAGLSDQTLLQVWKKYISFEALVKKPDGNLGAFIAKWQKARQLAESAGCHYSDLALACKLVEKVNLSEEAVVSLFAEIQLSFSQGQSVLDQVLAYIETYSLRVLPLREEVSSETFETKVHFKDSLKVESLDDVPREGEEDIDECDLVQLSPISNYETSDLVERKPPTKLCPMCSTPLSSDEEGFLHDHLGVCICDNCNIQLLVRLVLKKKEVAWEYLVLSKCSGCSNYLTLKSASATDEKEFELVCTSCDITISHVSFGGKMVTLDEALSKKVWGKKCFKIKTSSAVSKSKFLRKRSSGLLCNFQCEICGKPFSRLDGMLNHRKTHSAEKLHKCEFCHKTFRTSYELKIHANVHTEEKFYICSFCGKKFTRHSTFSEHTNIHTKAKSYDCEKCDAKFVHRNSLIYHIRGHHTGERPYKCDQCEWSFYTAFKLTQHKRIHTGEKPHKCKFCNKAFRLSGTLNRHMKLHCKGGNSSSNAEGKAAMSERQSV